MTEGADIDDGPLMRVVDIASWILMAIGGVVIILLMLHITADVAGKYFFNTPIIGTLEIVSRYYMVAVVFLPLAFVQIRRQHLTVEMFTMKITTGNIRAMRRPATSEVWVSSVLTCSKRSVSSGSRTKARTTRMPTICSRRTRLT